MWLLNYGVVHLTKFVMVRKSVDEDSVSSPFKGYSNLLASVFVFALYSGLVLTDSETMLILKFTGIITGGALLAYLLYNRLLLRLVIKR